MSFNKYDVKDRLTIEDIYTLLDYLGAEPQDYGEYLVCRTICHGGDSHKLFYYDNDGAGLFKCYTHCQDSFDVFELIQKVQGIDLNSAIYYIVNFFNLQHVIDEVEEENLSDDWKHLRKWASASEVETNNEKIVLPEIDNVIKYYPNPIIVDWEDEYIKKEVCDYMGIKYNPSNGSILIPHNDENGRLIGIRQRTLVKDDEIYGKYRPAKINNKMYNHPLGWNLYGLDKAKDRIGQIGVAMVFESEKAAIQTIGYLGTENNIAVSMCGSSLSNYQFHLLLDAGAKEICIGIDRDFHELYDEEYQSVVSKMEKMYNKYSPFCNISFMLDLKGLTKYKASPTDCGRDKFIELWRTRLVPNQ